MSIPALGLPRDCATPALVLGPLATWFGIVDADGFVMDNDNATRSAVVHQWDRFFDELCVATLASLALFAAVAACRWALFFVGDERLISRMGTLFSA